MLYRQLDADGDYMFGYGKKSYLEGVSAVAQAIKTRLLLLYAEWWEDREDGLPLWERILGTSGSDENIQAVDYIIKDRIQKTDGVLSVSAYTSDFNHDRREYGFRCVVETLYGSLIISTLEDLKS
jgi:hypothetical protein